MAITITATRFLDGAFINPVEGLVETIVASADVEAFPPVVDGQVAPGERTIGDELLIPFTL